MAKRRPYIPADIVLPKKQMEKIVKEAAQLKVEDVEGVLKFLVDSGYSVKFSTYQDQFQVTATERESSDGKVHYFVSTRSQSPLLSLHATLRKIESCEGGDLKNAKGGADPDVLFT